MMRISRRALSCLAAVGALAGLAGRPALAQLVYFGDELGNVGVFNAASNTATPLGSLAASGFSPGQVVGLAYDPTSDAVLLFDRLELRVYTMNATTGIASTLFNPGIALQGGAVANGLVYGINDATQTVEAFSFAGVNQNLTSGALNVHTHALGVNPRTGQLVSGSLGEGNFFVVNADGTQGATLVTSVLVKEDVDFFLGDFLVASLTGEIRRVNGVTGTDTPFITPTQVAAAGLTAALSGVAARASSRVAAAAPEPGSLTLLATGLLPVLGAVVMKRRNSGRKQSTTAPPCVHQHGYALRTRRRDGKG